jgi:hypothetical protein
VTRTTVHPTSAVGSPGFKWPRALARPDLRSSVATIPLAAHKRCALLVDAFGTQSEARSDLSIPRSPDSALSLCGALNETTWHAEVYLACCPLG